MDTPHEITLRDTAYKAYLFAEHLRMFMAQHRYTTQQMGDIIGKSKATISRVCNAKADLCLADFLSICAAMDRNPFDYLWMSSSAAETVDHFRANF